MRYVLLCVTLLGLLAIPVGVLLLAGAGWALIAAGVLAVAEVEWQTRLPADPAPRPGVRR